MLARVEAKDWHLELAAGSCILGSGSNGTGMASTAFADSVGFGREGHYYSYGLFDGTVSAFVRQADREGRLLRLLCSFFSIMFHSITDEETDERVGPTGQTRTDKRTRDKRH